MSNDSETTDGAAVRFPPPFVPLIALGVGLLLQFFVYALPFPLHGALRFGLAGVLIVAGVGFLMMAMKLFSGTGQDPKPWESTPEIIATGIYRFTRNPMYVSMGLLQAGIGVALANVWVVGLVPVTWATIYMIAIRHEEAYLERKFGAAYTNYKESVRRWI